jgi:Caspase domain
VVVVLAASSSAAAAAPPGRLPDPRRSYAVLIGNAAYASADLDDLPAVAGSLTELAEVLTDPALGAFLPGRCIVMPDPASARMAYRALRNYAALAHDMLLVYWAGHGGAGPRDELYLSVNDTGPGELPVSALAIGAIREVMLASPAANRVLILDCCLGGDAAPVSGVTGALAAQAAIDGGHALVSALPGPACFSPPLGMYTAFTGALIGLLRGGVPGEPELLTLDDIHHQLLYALASRGLPRPQQYGLGAGQLALVRNPGYGGRRERDGRWDASPRPPQRAAKSRSLLAAAGVVVALGLSVTLTNLSQHQARPAQKAGHLKPFATVNQTALSFPVSFTVDVSPAAILDPATRSHALSRVISRINRQISQRNLQGRQVGLVQIFASGSITGIVGSERAAHFVLNSIRRRDTTFAKAAGQTFWTGNGDYFVFQIYFFT